jgi:hypothetical protein
MAEFEEVRRRSQERLTKALIAQKEAAKVRNKALLEEILMDKDVCHPARRIESECNEGNNNN